MILLETANVVAANTFLAGCASDWKVQVQFINAGACAPLYLSRDTRLWFLKSLERIRDAARELDMIASAAAAQRAFDDCLGWFAAENRYDGHDLQKLVSHADKVLHVFGDEIRAKLIFVLPAQRASFFYTEHPFGESVEDSFPSITYDTEEAARCRALGRWTACVMHIMRVLETGLGALARHYNVDPDNNWNTVLNQIEAKSREVAKRTHGKEAEQWAAEAGTHLRFIKNAWRNHAMHPLEKYDEDRSVTIYNNARAFMQHLATQLSE